MDLAHLLLEHGHWHGNVVLAEAEEPADSDDRVRQRPAGRHDQVVDVADLVAGIVVDVLPENLLLRAPSGRDFSQLRDRDADHGRPGRLRRRVGRAGGHHEAHEYYEDYDSHRSLLLQVRSKQSMCSTDSGAPTTEYARHRRPWNWTLVPSSPVILTKTTSNRCCLTAWK